LGPARLIASNELEDKLRDLYNKEIEWHKQLAKDWGKESTEEDKMFGDVATEARMAVEREMRKEKRVK
jgi:hypothetical protein